MTHSLNPSYIFLANSTPLKHHESHTTEILLIQLVLLINPAGNRLRPVVEDIVVELAIAAAKLLLLQEERVVHEGEGVEDVKLEALGQDEGVVGQAVEAGLVRLAVIVFVFGKAGVGGVVEHIGDADDVMLGVVDDGRLDAVEGEEVGNLLVGVLESGH